MSCTNVNCTWAVYMLCVYELYKGYVYMSCKNVMFTWAVQMLIVHELYTCNEYISCLYVMYAWAAIWVKCLHSIYFSMNEVKKICDKFVKLLLELFDLSNTLDTRCQIQLKLPRSAFASTSWTRWSESGRSKISWATKVEDLLLPLRRKS